MLRQTSAPARPGKNVPGCAPRRAKAGTPQTQDQQAAYGAESIARQVVRMRRTGMMRKMMRNDVRMTRQSVSGVEALAVRSARTILRVLGPGGVHA